MVRKPLIEYHPEMDKHTHFLLGNYIHITTKDLLIIYNNDRYIRKFKAHTLCPTKRYALACGLKCHTMRHESMDPVASCFILGLKDTLVTVSLCPLKCRSRLGSSWLFQIEHTNKHFTHTKFYNFYFKLDSRFDITMLTKFAILSLCINYPVYSTDHNFMSTAQLGICTFEFGGSSDDILIRAHLQYQPCLQQLEIL